MLRRDRSGTLTATAETCLLMQAKTDEELTENGWIEFRPILDELRKVTANA